MELLLGDCEGVVKRGLKDDFGVSVVVTPTSRVDVLNKAARAKRTGCVALG
jgi:hypothetical protein